MEALNSNKAAAPGESWVGYNISLLKALTFSHVRPALSIRLQTLTGRLRFWLFPEGTEWELRNAVKQLPTFLKP